LRSTPFIITGLEDHDSGNWGLDEITEAIGNDESNSVRVFDKKG
jgi:hypothetical protein